MVTVLGSGSESTILDSNVLAQRVQADESSDAVIIACGFIPATAGTTGSPAQPARILTTEFSSSSANAPSVAEGVECAQALADLFDAGFDIVAGGSGLTYTLIK